MEASILILFLSDCNWTDRLYKQPVLSLIGDVRDFLDFKKFWIRDLNVEEDAVEDMVDERVAYLWSFD